MEAILRRNTCINEDYWGMGEVGEGCQKGTNFQL